MKVFLLFELNITFWFLSSLFYYYGDIKTLPVLGESEHVFCLFLQVVSEESHGWVWREHRGFEDWWEIFGDGHFISGFKTFAMAFRCVGQTSRHLPFPFTMLWLQILDYLDCFLLYHFFPSDWSVKCSSDAKMHDIITAMMLKLLLTIRTHRDPINFSLCARARSSFYENCANILM